LARSRKRFTLVLLATLLLALVIGPAAAHPGHEHLDLRVAKIVALPGQAEEEAQQSAALTGQRYPWLFERTEEDRPEERTGRLIHVVYLLAAANPDDHYDELGVIEDSIRSMNVWMKQQTGNQQWRFDTYTFQPESSPTPVNAIDVTFIHSSKPSPQLNSATTVQAELEAHGLDDNNKRYLSYVASNAGGVCGDAWYPFTPDATPVDGQYSQVYLYSSAGCRAQEFAPNATTPSFAETIAMQEMIHNDGMVPLVAPHDCVVSPLAFGHVCTGPLWATDLDPERFDVMYPYVGLPLSEKQLDADHLDYYRQLAPYKDLEQSLYLETV
jgi:hypothetical protein